MTNVKKWCLDLWLAWLIGIATCVVGVKLKQEFWANVQGWALNESGGVITNAVMRIGPRIIHAKNGWFATYLPHESEVIIEAPGYAPWRGTMIPNGNNFAVQLQCESDSNP